MENVFLYNLYLKAPSFFKKKIINYINKAEGGQMYSPTLRKIYKEEHNIEIGYGSYGGCFSAGNVPPNVTFGNYCSIAQNIRIFRANHPKETFTSHPLLYNPIAGYVTKDQLDRPKLNIGHDVWIGEWSVILPGVKNIGNGAIIGAGSIVTKDVEPYSIMVGNSAKKIAKRFSDEVIESLEKTQWWNLNKDELIAVIDSLNSIARGGKAK